MSASQVTDGDNIIGLRYKNKRSEARRTEDEANVQDGRMPMRRGMICYVRMDVSISLYGMEWQKEMLLVVSGDGVVNANGQMLQVEWWVCRYCNKEY